MFVCLCLSVFLSHIVWIDNGEGQECVLSTKDEFSSKRASPNEVIEGTRQKNNVETIGPTSEDTMGPAVSDVTEIVAGNLVRIVLHYFVNAYINVCCIFCPV